MLVMMMITKFMMLMMTSMHGQDDMEPPDVLEKWSKSQRISQLESEVSLHGRCTGCSNTDFIAEDNNMKNMSFMFDSRGSQVELRGRAHLFARSTKSPGALTDACQAYGPT